MPTPREFYKSTHPEYFSDSEVSDATELDRSLLEYHLDSLTKRNQEADFERFARRLCEREVCPNLLPTTGPTGGGDSKADSETFPVTNLLALKWYGGLAQEAAGERWAFAFSAKAQWVSKIKSDIDKIVETARGYKKAFFVTNQAVPAKKRAEVEDELRTKHRIDVRILDRTWILDRIFTGHHEQIAVDELAVTALARPIAKQGPNDAARLAELEATEARITDAVSAGRIGLSLVDDALEAAELCRVLEKPRNEIEGAYARADRLAMKCGTERQQVEAAYQLAWTIFWWFEDVSAVMRQYEVVESRARDSHNSYDLERLHNLWTVLSTDIALSGDQASKDWLDRCTAVIESALRRVSADTSRPSNSLSAESTLLQCALIQRLQADEEPGDILRALRGVIARAEGLVGFALKPLVESLSVLGARLDNSEAYDELFQSLVDAQAKRAGEVTAARLLLRRGEQLREQGRLTRAIALVGQALTRLFKHETRADIVYALYLCGSAYKRLGLLWAARGAFLSGASIAANDFWRYSHVSPGFAANVRQMKWVELRLGRLAHVLTWHELDLTVQSLRNETETDERQQDESGFDVLVAQSILKTPADRHVIVGNLAPELDRMGLIISASSASFLLGHTDRMNEIAKEIGGAQDTGETLAGKILSMRMKPPIRRDFATDWGHTQLSTRILGCMVTVRFSPEQPCLEVGEAILSVLESLVSTVATERAIPFEPEVSMEIILDRTPTSIVFVMGYEPEPTIEMVIESPSRHLVSVEERESQGKSHFMIQCVPFDPADMNSEEREKIRDDVFFVGLNIFPNVVQFHDFESELEILFKEERAAERASAFTGSFGALRNVLGPSPRFTIEEWIDGRVPMKESKRSVPWEPQGKNDTDRDAPRRQRPLQPAGDEAPPGLFDRSQIRHDQMQMLSPIRQRLWERANWCGVFFQGYRGADAPPPLLGLIFRDRQAGRSIFEGWAAELGDIDEGKVLRITVIRGISRANPFAYRVVIGANPESASDEAKVFTILSKSCSMDASTPANLEGFLAAYREHRRFVLIPTFVDNDIPQPESDVGLGIYDLYVRDAWEIGLNDTDSAGIFLSDDVLIPEGIDDPPIHRLQQWKREREKN